MMVAALAFLPKKLLRHFGILLMVGRRGKRGEKAMFIMSIYPLTLRMIDGNTEWCAVAVLPTFSSALRGQIVAQGQGAWR
ncbi:MAG: hypothetical protein IPP88_22375 [Betaproteobacteria bacterium]|nr:hypothetical protein [Betaproteobacteria bacterium]